MNARNFIRWCQEKINSYNLFIPDEDVDSDDELEDPATVIKHQRYTTRLYVSLLIGT